MKKIKVIVGHESIGTVKHFYAKHGEMDFFYHAAKDISDLTNEEQNDLLNKLVNAHPTYFCEIKELFIKN